MMILSYLMIIDIGILRVLRNLVVIKMGVYVLHQICLSAFDHITDTSVHITTSSGMIVCYARLDQQGRFIQ